MKMNERDYQLFAAIAKVSQEDLAKALMKLMAKYYDEKHRVECKEFLMYIGKAPVLILAHMDTVFSKSPQHVFFDPAHQALWSPEGLGADDRAGIFSIIKILQRGYRPSICFTTDEEIGGVGADMLTTYFPKPPVTLKYCIQLDRRGAKDCVFYHCDNPDFEEYVEKFGFITNYGTFTDISIICPEWEVAGVNLSVGYINEHSYSETLFIKHTYATIDKVCKMLDDVDNADEFKYIPMYINPYLTKMFSDRISAAKAANGHVRHKCYKCGKEYDEDDVFPVKARDPVAATHYYCIDCVGEGVNWCAVCGEPFETKTPNDAVCPDCLGDLYD